MINPVVIVGTVIVVHSVTCCRCNSLRIVAAAAVVVTIVIASVSLVGTLVFVFGEDSGSQCCCRLVIFYFNTFLSCCCYLYLCVWFFSRYLFFCQPAYTTASIKYTVPQIQRGLPLKSKRGSTAAKGSWRHAGRLHVRRRHAECRHGNTNRPTRRRR